MASSKQTLASSLCMAAIFFLLFFTHSLAIRPIVPASSPSPPSFSVTPTDQLTMNLTSSLKNLEVKRSNNVEESCEGNIGEEECLMRRTLAAHLDYIYTQKQNP